MRRIPSQVPDTVSRLLKSTLILSPPIWYLPVLSNPPPILPVRRSRPRPTLNQAESTKSKQKGPKTRPQSIVYAEDRLRRQFFRDFPFEAMRPVSLVEGREVRVESEVEGPEWTGLEQRGAYPSVEDCIAYVLNIRKYWRLPISQAYARGVEEFVRLRARHEMATMAAEMEARNHGADFLRDPYERSFYLDGKALDSIRASGSEGQTAPTRVRFKEPKRWSAIVPPTAVPTTEFAGGQNYVKRWRLPPPLEVETEAAKEVVKVIPAPVQEAPEQAEEEEEELDDLAFLRSALSVPSKDG